MPVINNFGYDTAISNGQKCSGELFKVIGKAKKTISLLPSPY
jgi:hypothetical protein